MSWTLFVVADRSDAEALVKAKPDDPRWSWTWIEQNTATLSVLGAALHGHDADAHDAIAFFDWKVLAEVEGDEGPWVFELPERLVSPLTTADLSKLATRWSSASFMDSYDDADLLAFLNELRGLLEEAEGRGCQVLFWEMQ